MIQQFTPDGNLTPGIHTYTMHEFEQQFINEFTTSIRRPLIFKSFKQWLSQLLQVQPPQYVWLDGSFLTMKVEPNDIDLVVFYYPENIQNQAQASELKELINRVSRTNNCDAFFSFSFEHLTPQQLAVLPHNNQRIMQTYWMGQFGFDRDRKPKGIVQINQQELLSSVTGGVN